MNDEVTFAKKEGGGVSRKYSNVLFRKKIMVGRIANHNHGN